MKIFIESEADEKLRRALRHKTRPSTSNVFQSGDQVFYKRSDSGYWKGPGTVIGQQQRQRKLKELENWRINKVYDEVDDEKQSSISVRQVLTEKMIKGKRQVKARLVARGFKDAGRDDVKQDSSTFGRGNLRL